jgi:hypothetical protein
MTYLPMNLSLLIVGGRNDAMCKNPSMPFLDDIFLFVLDLKAWIQVKYLKNSLRLSRIANHSTTLV